MRKSDGRETFKSPKTNKRLTFVRSAAKSFCDRTFTFFPLNQEQCIDSGYEYTCLLAVLICFVQPQNAVSRVPEDSPCYSSKYIVIRSDCHNHDGKMSSPLL